MGSIPAFIDAGPNDLARRPSVPAPPSDAAPGPTATLTAYAAATKGRLMSCQSMPMRYAIPRPVEHGHLVCIRQDIREWEGDAMRFLRDQGLAITMFGIFAVTMVGLVLTG